MKIAVDAMGGDYAPDVVVSGAVAAAQEYDVDIILVGDQPRIEKLLSKSGYKGERITIRHASEVVGMSEPAATSFRRKKDSSIARAIELVKNNQADAFFSAGNTGAVVCAATLSLGLLPGIERPGIAIIVPTLHGISLIVDVGANIDPKPLHLMQYGVMADAYSRYILNKSKPVVGLLNIGEEESKGTDFMKETHNLFSKSKLNFIGNVEGKDLFSGKCDCVVCDGFVGNVALKVSESLAETLYIFLKREFMSSIMGKIGVLFLLPAIRRFKKRMDYSEYGGAPLFGVNGVVMIGHGRSNVKAIKNAIRVASEEVERNVNEKILE
ncbi:MAG: phosphate acyltransferase PlsX, partial [Candidatus Omnitrophica bacterium]|nr:phosphate acyltransferase PlsX [Candidatus Omnitrophota bacterium]